MVNVNLVAVCRREIKNQRLQGPAAASVPPLQHPRPPYCTAKQQTGRESTRRKQVSEGWFAGKRI